MKALVFFVEVVEEVFLDDHKFSLESRIQGLFIRKVNCSLRGR